MNDTILLVIAAMVGMAMIGSLSYAVISRQQHTIDVLTNKLMAKNYQEYSRAIQVTTDTKEPRMSQLSWFDDPHEEKEDDA